MNAILRLIGVVLPVMSLGVSARETQEMAFSVKNEDSDLVIVGVATSPPMDLEGKRGQAYVNVRIEAILKGQVSSSDIKFIVRGFSDELNPRCCVAEKRYLIFAKEGFDVFDFDPEGSGEVGLIRRGRGEYYSGVNGPYSTYLLVDDERASSEPLPNCK